MIRIMVFWGTPKVRIFIPLTLFWVLLGGLTGCTTLRGGLLTEADLPVSSSSGLENISFESIQQMNQRAKKLIFEGSIFVSTPNGTDRSRVNVRLTEQTSLFEIQGRMGVGKMDLQCGSQTNLSIDPPQELSSEEESILDVLCQSIYPLTTLSSQYEWSLVEHDQPEFWGAKTQTNVDGEPFRWTLERFNQTDGLVLPQKLTLQHTSEPFRVRILLKVIKVESTATKLETE
ncbi:MAG: hypothetical protein RI519_03830 [Balneolaceae bacterium]|nr:hypothetical protein [Balneolaceae bacterium]